MFAQLLLVAALTGQVAAKPFIDPRLLQLAESASKIEVYQCKLLPSPPFSSRGLLRPRLIAIGKPKRISRSEGARLLERLRAIPNLWNPRAGAVAFMPTVLVRYYAKRNVDLTIDAKRGVLSLDDSTSAHYSMQTVRDPKDPQISNLAAFIRRNAR